MALLQVIRHEGKKTRGHFDVMVEQAEGGLGLASKDHLSLHDDRLAIHDQRLDKLEVATGIK